MEKALKVLKDGGVIVFPTDTVYGLLADYNNEKAIKRIYQIKKRDKKPLPVFVKDIEMAKKLAIMSSKTEEFLNKVWPGKVTVILKKKDGSGTIGLRVPDYPLLNELLEKINKPLAQTSANISGKGSLYQIEKVKKQIKGADLIVDVGDLSRSLPSTVIDLINNKILRKGENYEKCKNLQFN